MQHRIIPQPNLLDYTDGICPAERAVPVVETDEAMPPEGYALAVRPDGVTVRCKTPQGLFYAKQTLSMLQNENGSLPCVSIQDAPRFAYRAFMLDSARHMQTIDEIKRYIDVAARFKMNVFHWHLSDDQGFRIECKRFPKLNEVGSFRDGHGFGSSDVSRYGGFYTKAEIRDIVSYCADRFIRVIPEIDMPGHTKAILASYPSLSCRETPIAVETQAGVFRDILCAGKEEVVSFCCDLLDEVCELFPDEWVHIGGDEAPKNRWRQCDCCKDRMAKAHLDSFEALQGDFMNRIAAHLRTKGKRAVAWNESIKSGCLDGDVIIADWMDRDKLCPKRANAGGEIIAEDFFHYYLDYPYAMTPLKKVYTFDPLPEGLTEMGRPGVIGVETPLWTEFIEDFEKLCKMAFPRLLAVAERSWTYEESCDYADFRRRAEENRPWLQSQGVVMDPQSAWDPKGLGRLKKLLAHYKKTLTRDMLLSFFSKKDD